MLVKLVPEVLDAELVGPSVDGGGGSVGRSGPELVEGVVVVRVRDRRVLVLRTPPEVVGREPSSVSSSRGRADADGRSEVRGRGRVRDHVGRVRVSLWS